MAKYLSIEVSSAYQNNLRKECSEPVSHGYMPKPDDDTERRFSKRTYTSNIGLRLMPNDKNEFCSGVNAEYQHNRRSGWGFIIPNFETRSFGVYISDKYKARFHTFS